MMGYACLVAIMSMGHNITGRTRLHKVTADNGALNPVVTSAGALIDGLHVLRAKKISLIAPYMKPLTHLVIDYIENEGIEVQDSISLEIANNLKVGALDPLAPAEIVKKLNAKDVDAIVLSACVQMPSLAAIQAAEDHYGLPVVSAAVCTTYQMLKKLGLKTVVPKAGSLLSGKF